VSESSPSQRRILVIEDDRDLAELVRIHFEDMGVAVDVAHHGRDGRDLALEGRHDLIVLDLSLPGLDGLDVCRELRAKKADTPILMLTARSSESDRVLGLELGADDYLTKPFSIRELVARARAIWRRLERFEAPKGASGDTVVVADIAIEPDKRKVTVRGEAIELTPREFDLLLHFARHPGRVYTRAELLDRVWGYQHGGYEHTVNSHINRLRAKIEADPEQPRHILTVWGVGYKFAEPGGQEG
jgi:DNA-binding response OmpR family regulator